MKPTAVGEALDIGNQSAPRVLKVAFVGSVPLLWRGVQTVVSADPSLAWVDGVDGIRAAIDLCETAVPDVVLISSHSDPGWSICQILTRLFRKLTVVALLGPEARTPTAMTRVRLHGARSLVPIEADSARLVTAIRRGAETGLFVDPQLRMNLNQLPLAARAEGRPLSRREFEVLRLVAQGHTAVQIASKLEISAETVRTHVGHILRKLGARDRAHAVAKAYEMSLLPS
jgi:DNA-binding NarL/FixJ family response regulator